MPLARALSLCRTSRSVLSQIQPTARTPPASPQPLTPAVRAPSHPLSLSLSAPLHRGLRCFEIVPTFCLAHLIELNTMEAHTRTSEHEPFHLNLPPSTTKVEVVAPHRT